MILKYFCPEDGDTIEDAHEITGKFIPDKPSEAQQFAQDAANYYWSNCDCDGYEDKWPKKFAVVGNGEILGVFSVSVDFDPVFYAEKCE